MTIPSLFLFFVLITFSLPLCFSQHFREHLDKLFAQGIGMLDMALTEAFNLLGDVSNADMRDRTP